MINKAYVFNFHSGSFVDQLIESGFSPYVIEWGDPGLVEADMSINDYIQRLSQFTESLIHDAYKSPVILGYCMGGVLAGLYASIAKDKIAGLALLATPWNSQSHQFTKFFDKFITNNRLIAKEFFQYGFYLPKFHAINSKYIEFGSAELINETWVEVESWVNDGVDMPKAIFEQFIREFSSNNYQNKAFHIGNLYYKMSDISCPTLAIVAKYDSVALIDATTAIKEMIDVDLVEISTGHVGLVVTNRQSTVASMVAWCKKKNINKASIV